MTDRKDSSMPEKTLRKRKETEHPELSLSSMCKVYLCVHVCAGIPLCNLSETRVVLVLLHIAVVHPSERDVGKTGCDATQTLFI